MKTAAIILAGGKGERFEYDLPKQFVNLNGKPIIIHTIEIFENHPLIDEIYVVINNDYYDYFLKIFYTYRYSKIKKILIGGKTRQESSRIGVEAVGEDIDKIIIHDAVRPFVSNEIISNVITSLDKHDAVDVAINTTDTIIEANSDLIHSIPQRDKLFMGQTPQGFKTKLIKEAHQIAQENNYNYSTCDCSLIKKYDLSPIKLIEGSEYNIKITKPIDLFIADKISQLKYQNLKIDPAQIKTSLENKVVVIYGGTSGIGEEIYNLCKEYNAHSYAYSRRNGVDITDFNKVFISLKEVYKKHKKIDVVICTSANLELGLLEYLEPNEILDQINVNLIGSIFVSKYSLPYLKETKGHLILFASSSYTKGRSGYVLYGASKAALVNFVQGLSEELSDVKINIINPQRTDTMMRRKNFGKENPDTLLNPRYVALNTLMLLSTDLTGSVINVTKKDEQKYFHGGSLDD